MIINGFFLIQGFYAEKRTFNIKTIMLLLRSWMLEIFGWNRTQKAISALKGDPDYPVNKENALFQRKEP